MADQVPIKGIFNGSGDPTGLAEFTVSDTIGYADGGTGLNTLGTAGQILKVNSGATGLEWGSIVATIDIDNATDLTSSTLVSSDQILISDGGTEGRVTLSQLDTLFSGTTQTLTNKTLENPIVSLIQSSGTILTLDHSVNELRFKNSGTNYLTLQQSNSNVRFIAEPDKQFQFIGRDDGTTITALTIDIAEAGNATFNNNVTVGNDLVVTGNLTVGSVSNTEFQYLDGVTSNLQTQLDNKASTGFAIAMAIAL
jgi:hypothetical protein